MVMNMIQLIEFAPRKYGTGVNREFLETNILSPESDPLKTLDEMEKQNQLQLLTKMKGTRVANRMEIIQYGLASSIIMPDRSRLAQSNKISDWKNNKYNKCL